MRLQSMSGPNFFQLIHERREAVNSHCARHLHNQQQWQQEHHHQQLDGQERNQRRAPFCPEIDSTNWAEDA
jgi:hypothetical protein